ncbi:ribonuclease P protein component [Nesterenkonia salmonea]|uniref:Ribonuclease P protein component n=1 Tax=Nesterenkonia salmonea TaxID=1804987 RepID=A0A5R9BB59_9MICC|nr:ribonuclease P protein component [Nesterenkonia salmonea]TLP95092.1 ribonuclease P protein component [Nesterenkonia salmonea]
MLPAPHRLTTSQDFATVMRRGSRAGSATVVVSARLLSKPAGPRWRCGFIVSKTVGNAVVRHRTTRRLRHIVAELMQSPQMALPDGLSVDFAVRALADAAAADHRTLRADVESSLRRSLRKAQRQ